MLKELNIAALSMLSQQTRLEVTANNISNASTPGFKKESVFERSLVDASLSLSNEPGNVEQKDAPVGTFTDYSQGAFQKTDNPLDIAVDTKNGFFTLQDEEGNQYLTRSGHFTISADGFIRATDGKFLTGTNGPMSILNEFSVTTSDFNDNKAANLRIAESGQVSINDRSVGNLQVVRVDNPESLKRISSTQFAESEETSAAHLSQDETVVKQGWLENSNVDIVSEMVKMLELQRMFELGSKVIQTNNETLDHTMRMGRLM
jgi:flagellar basal-body rod protein FlgG